ncbi:MAG: IPT/TIG domain-containing protein [Burkholderiales bacterium]
MKSPCDRRWIEALRTVAALCLLMVGATPGSQAQTIQYTYDAAGRLTGVTNTVGETAEYVYDAAGNIVQIRRTATNVPAVTGFTPASGPVGTAVTIVGANFGATPAANTVRFNNGTAATVTSASVTQLVATVPVGATSGPISVQTAAGTGTSSRNFAVTASGALPAPTLATFTPALALPGSIVTLTGTNFDTAPGMTKVYLNQALVKINAITSTSIDVVVPGNTGSGRFQVSTLAGTATSTADFVVIPPSTSLWVANQYAGVQRIVLDGTTGSFNVSAGATDRWVVFLFDGGPTAHASVDFIALTPTPSDTYFVWEVRDPRNLQTTSAEYEDANRVPTSLRAMKRSVHIPPMLQSGTYALFVHLWPNTTFNATAKLRTDPYLPTDNATGTTFSLNTSTGTPPPNFVGQTLRYVFNGYQTQWLGLGIQALSTTPSALVGFDIRMQDWRKLTGGELAGGGFNCPSGNCGVDLPRLPENGVYSLIANTNSSAFQTVNATLWLSTDLQLGNLALDTDVNVPTLKQGQNARLTFVGTAGQRYGLSTSDTVTPVNMNPAAVASVFDSSRQAIAGTSLTLATGQIYSLEYPSLPYSDTYSLLINPTNGATISTQLRRWQAKTGTLTPGNTVALSLSKGQPARYTFTATAGQNLGLAVSGLIFDPVGTSGWLTFQVIRESDSTVVAQAGATCVPGNPGGRCSLNLPSLNAGTYRVDLTPPNNVRTTNFSLVLSTEVTATVTPGTVFPLSIGTYGQNARLTLNGTVGQGISLRFSEMSFAPNQGAKVTIYRPDNSLFYQPPTDVNWASGSPTTFDLPAFNVSGPYQIFFDPGSGATGTVNLLASQAVTGPIAIDGASVPITLGYAGQTARITFSNSGGVSTLGLGVSGLSVTPAGAGGVTLRVRKPDDTEVASKTCNPSDPGNGCHINLSGLGAVDHTIWVHLPPGATGAALTLTLSTDLTGTLPLGITTTVSVSRRGRDARFTFNATAGQNRRITIANPVTGPSPTNASIPYTVFRPSPQATTVLTQVPGGGSVDLGNLPLTGDYTIWFDQGNGLTFSVDVTVTSY